MICGFIREAKCEILKHHMQQERDMWLEVCVLLLVCSSCRCSSASPCARRAGSINVLFVSAALESGAEESLQLEALQLQRAVKSAEDEVNNDNSSCHLSGNQLNITVEHSKVLCGVLAAA